jgi:hypothetical protein
MVMALAVNRSGTIFKRSDTANRRPDSNKGCPGPAADK